MEKIRVGIFGLRRGGGYFNSIVENNGEIVAICDFDKDSVELTAEQLGNKPAKYTDFDSFIQHPMDAVLLFNFFHEHAKYAIACLEKGIHVLSECTANSTLAEGVALVRAAEKSSAHYMLAENYPFMLFNQEMKRVYEGGTLGKVLFAEGEYNHAGNPNDTKGAPIFTTFERHWRAYLPRTYYITHSLAPIMYATGSNPVRVTAFPIYKPSNNPNSCSCSQVADRAAIVTCLNDDNSVFRVTGHASFGASDNSYRLCCEKGQIENVRGTEDMVMLRYNPWDLPEGKEVNNFYKPEWNDKDADKIEKAGHGGGDFFVIRKFFESIRENKRPDFDVYFATRLSSVAIMAHRSVLANGMPYDIPDFRREEDRVKYENDHTTPFWSTDGKAPNIPCCSHPDYRPSEQQLNNYRKAAEEHGGEKALREMRRIQGFKLEEKK